MVLSMAVHTSRLQPRHTSWTLHTLQIFRASVRSASLSLVHKCRCSGLTFGGTHNPPAAWAAAVRDALPAPYQALADCGAGLGMRQGEVFGLAVGDIDFLRRVVHVRRQVRIVGARLVFAPPKGGKERDIPLPSSIALRLSAHIAAFPPVAVSLPWKAPGGKPATAALVFTSREHAAMNRNYVNTYLWKPTLKQAGMPQTRENGFHALRHYFASSLQFGQRGGHPRPGRLPRPP